MANIDLLKSMSDRIPEASSKAATRAQEAQITQFQAGLASAPKLIPTNQSAQQVGAALTQAQGQAAVQQAQQSAQATQRIGQAVLNEQKFQGSQELQKLEREQGLALGNAARQQAVAGQEADIMSRKRITKQETDQAQRLQALGIDQDNRLLTLTLKQREDISKLGRDTKAELFDKQLAFEKDERGRKFSNERQLMDYAVLKAKSDIDLQKTLQKMQQDAERDIIMMEAVNNKLKQALTQKSAKGQQELDQGSKMRIKKSIEDNNKRIADKRRKAAQRGMIIKGAFTIAGAVAGTYIPGAGPVAGAAVGGGVGEAVAGGTENV